MKHLALVLALILASAGAARAQLTAVSATVVDPAGIPYVNGTVKAVLTTPGGPSPSLNNAPFTTSIGPVPLSAIGAFSLNLADNNVVLPAGTQWAFTVCMTPGTPPPLGQQGCFTVTLTITGASQTISTQLNAAALPLSRFSSYVFNVKNFGAKGDAQKIVDGAWSVNGNVITSASGLFKSSDVGKIIWGVDSGGNSRFAANTTITGFNSATSVTVSSLASGGAAGASVVWGTDDTAALQAAAGAARTAAGAIGSGGNVIPIFTTVQSPAGGYIFSKLPFANNYAASTYGFNVIGSGRGTTWFYPAPYFDFTTTNSGQGMLNRSDNAEYEIGGFTLDGSGMTYSGAPGQVAAVQIPGASSKASDILVQNISGGIDAGVGFYGGSNVFALRLVANVVSPIGIHILNGSYNLVGVTASNGGTSAQGNVVIDNVNGAGNGGPYVNFFGGLNDEGNGVPLKINNSTDVNVFGVKLFAPSGGPAVQVDGTSVARFVDCQIGPFGSNANSSGLTVLAGGQAYLSGSRLYSSGTGFALNNAGTVFDIGGNTYTNNTGTPPVQAGTLDTTISLTPAAPGAVPGCSTDVTGTITGSLTTDKVLWSPPATAVAGQLGMAWISVNGTVSLRWCQFSGAAAAPPSGNYRFKITRP